MVWNDFLIIQVNTYNFCLLMLALFYFSPFPGLVGAEAEILVIKIGSASSPPLPTWNEIKKKS